MCDKPGATFLPSALSSRGCEHEIDAQGIEDGAEGGGAASFLGAGVGGLGDACPVCDLRVGEAGFSALCDLDGL